MIRWLVRSTSKELIKEAGEGLQSLQMIFCLKSERPFTAQELKTISFARVFCLEAALVWCGEEELPFHVPSHTW